MKEPFQPSPIDDLLKAVADSLDAHTSALFEPIPGGGLRISCCCSLSDQLADNCVLEPGQGPVGWVHRAGRPLNIARFRKDSRTIGIYSKDVGIKSFMAVPLPEKSGVLMADSKTRLKFTDRHLRILSSFARCASHLMDTLHHRAVNRTITELLLWDTCSSRGFQQVLLDLMKILDLETCLVLRRVKGKGFYKLESVLGEVRKDAARRLTGRRYPVGRGVCGWIFRHSKDIVLSGFGADPERSFLLEPGEDISSKGSVIGIFFPHDPDAFFRLDHALVLCGRGRPESWPDQLPQVLRKRLGGVVPWRSVS